MPKVLVNLLQSTGTKGGIEIYAKELYRQEALRNSEFTFIGLASRELFETDTSWFPGEIVNSGISGENRISWAFGELFSVQRYAKKYGADLIHGPAMFGPLTSSVPVVISIHDLLYFSHPELMQSKVFTEPVKWMEKVGARNAKRIITISEYSSRAIQKYLHIPSSMIDVIPLAGRKTAFSESRNKQIRRDDLFLAIGQRSPYKNFETIIIAWSLIPEDSRPQLVITGSHGEDPLMPLVKELQLEPWVTLMSWVSIEVLDELFNSATAIIDSTLASGFSMPTLEAMNIGLPTLLADSEVFQEVGGDAAAYFSAGNPNLLALAVQNLSENSELREQLSKAGKLRASKYSWEKVAEQTLTTFRKSLEAN